MSMDFFDEFCSDYYFYLADYYESRIRQGNKWIFYCTDDTQQVFSYDADATSNFPFCLYPFFVCHANVSNGSNLLFICKVNGKNLYFQYVLDGDALISRIRTFTKNRGLSHVDPLKLGLSQHELIRFHEYLVTLFKALPQHRLHFVTSNIQEMHNIDKFR